MKQCWEEEDPIDHWTLTDIDKKLFFISRSAAGVVDAAH
jgi:hypothetical protein